MNPILDVRKVFTGNGHPALAKSVCEYLDIPVGQAEVFKFANDNTFVRIHENIRQRDVFIVQPTCFPVNDNLMELLIMIDACKRASAGRITAVVPYFAYSRSDKKDQPRVPITARLVANFLEVAGADRVLTIDLHAGQVQGFFNIPVDELTAMPLLADYFRSLELNNAVVVAPDVGDAKRARNVATRMGCDIAIVDKRRTGNDEEAEAMTLMGDVDGRDCVLVDDEIVSGGTMISSIRLLHERGARGVYVGCVHPVFAELAFEVLDTPEITEIVFTDTLPLAHGEFRQVPSTVLSTAPLIGDAIHRIHTGGSVGALFR